MKAPMNHGNVWLRGMMGEVAWASIRTRATYFRAQFRRLSRRRGPKKAAVAVAHTLLIVIYHVLRAGEPHTELGVDYFNTLSSARLERHHVRRLEQLGYKVSLTPLWLRKPRTATAVSGEFRSGWALRPVHLAHAENHLGVRKDNVRHLQSTTK